MAPRGGPMPRDVQVSKKLSKLLRHGAEKEGLSLSADGYVNLASVLASRDIKSLKVTLDEVLQIVHDNDKQRFSLVPDPARQQAERSTSCDSAPAMDKADDWLIRANQGHSIKIEEDGGLLTPIGKDNMPSTAVHGTTHANWPLIVASGGLKPMRRNHVHFASGLPAGFKVIEVGGSSGTTEAPVISGMRSSSTVLMFLDISKALDAGLNMGLSANGVILTQGNAEGLVPLELFSRVEDRTGQGVLVEAGQIVKEAPSTWIKKKI